VSGGSPGASTLFPYGQEIQQFQVHWGVYATAATLPNGAGNILVADKFVNLRVGHIADVTGVGLYLCTVVGTAGGGDATWVSQAGGAVSPGVTTTNAVVRWGDATGTSLLNSVAILSNTGELTLGDGAPATPAVRGTTDVTSGVYFGVAAIAFSIAGAARWYLTGDSLLTAVPFPTLACAVANGALRIGGLPGASSNSPAYFYAQTDYTGAAGATQSSLGIAADVNQTLTAAFTGLGINFRGPAGVGAPVFGTGSLGSTTYAKAIDFQTANTSRAYISTDGRFAAADGTAALPGLTFQAEPTQLGIYRYASTELGIGMAGSPAWRISRTDIQNLWGSTVNIWSSFAVSMQIGANPQTTATPSVILLAQSAFTGGAGVAQVNTVISSGVSQGGAAGAAFTALLINTTNTSPGTGLQLATDFMIGGVSQGHVTSGALLRMAVGAVGTPSHSFIGRTTDGMYSIAANSLGLATNAVLRLTVDTAAITPTLPIIPNANNTLDLGTAALSFRDIFIDGSVRGTWPFFVKTFSGTAADNGGAIYYMADAGPTQVLNTVALNYPVSRASTSQFLRVYVTTNTVGAAVTATVYKNGAATGITVSITADTTGAFNDLVNTATWAAGDQIDLRLDVGGAGIGVVIEMTLSATLEFYVP
jgi:hypothetical protein